MNNTGLLPKIIIPTCVLAVAVFCALLFAEKTDSQISKASATQTIFDSDAAVKHNDPTVINANSRRPGKPIFGSNLESQPAKLYERNNESLLDFEPFNSDTNSGVSEFAKFASEEADDPRDDQSPITLLPLRPIPKETRPSKLRSLESSGELQKLRDPNSEKSALDSRPLLNQLRNDLRNDVKSLRKEATQEVLNSQSQPNTTSNSDQPVSTIPLANENATAKPDVFNDEKSDPVWWYELVFTSFLDDRELRKITLNELLYRALESSPRINAISQKPLIEDTRVFESLGEFDPLAFLETEFNDNNDPVGNLLTTGGSPFLREHIWSGKAGVSKKNQRGGTASISQEFGFKNSNSQFFDPQDQGTATLSLSFTQPLLRDAGRFVNQSQVLIAQKVSDVAWERFQVELQNELLKVSAAYWDLYRTRSIYLQRQASVIRGEEILQKIINRRKIDVTKNQIRSAEATIARRVALVVDARRSFQNAETELLSIVGLDAVNAALNYEFVPSELPSNTRLNWDLKKVVEMGIQTRPEIREGLQRVEKAIIEAKVSKNQLLPDLSLTFGAYAAGLEGGTGIERAFQDQFLNTPGFNAGIKLSRPRRNLAAISRQRADLIKYKQAKAEFTEVKQTIEKECIVAVRSLNAAYEFMLANRDAIEKVLLELKQQQVAWDTNASLRGDTLDGQNGSLRLDQLLETQNRLSDAESKFVESQYNFKIAQLELRQAMGTLLETARVMPVKNKTNDDGIPTIEYQPNQTRADSQIPNEVTDDPVGNYR